MGATDSSALVASILNAAWMVRHYARGGRSSIERARRTQAIQFLGVTVRDAFNQSDDYESLLAAVVDGLRPHHNQPF
jgi:hypothetical protein